MIDRSEMFAIGFVMPVVAGVAVCLRFASAHRQSRFGADNYSITFGFIILVACCILTLVATFLHGYGRQANSGAEDDSELLRSTKKFTVIIDTLIDLALMGCKLALLLFYRRIFIGRAFNVITYTAAVLIVAWAVTMFFLSLFQCGSHFSYVWRSAKMLQEYCLPGARISLWNSSFDVLMDLVVIGIPLYYVQMVRLSRGKRILVTLLFAFGGLAIVASVLRLVAYTGIFPKHNESPDQIQFLTKVTFYCLLETGLAVIAACLPTYGTLLSTRQRQRLEAALDRTFPSLHLSRVGKAGNGAGRHHNGVKNIPRPQATQWVSPVEEKQGLTTTSLGSSDSSNSSSEPTRASSRVTNPIPDSEMQLTNHSTDEHFIRAQLPGSPPQTVIFRAK